MSSRLLGPEHTASVCAFFDDPTQFQCRNLERALVLGHVFVAVGDRHPGFLETIPAKVRDEIPLISAAFIEVQQNLFSGTHQYVPLSFPQTKKVMNRYCSMRMDPDKFFQKFSVLSYRILPFEQCAFGNPSFDLKLLESIRRTRRLTAGLFLEMTDPPEDEEDKKMAGMDLEKAQRQSLELTSHLFCVGAFYHPGTQVPVKFIDLLDAWVDHSPDRESVRKRISERVVVALPDVDATRVDKSHLQHVDGTFREFLTKSTLENIQVCLGFVLTKETFEVLGKWYSGEYLRMDIAFFISRPRELCSLKLSEYFDQTSTFKLEAFQLFFLIVKHEGVVLEKQPQLLEMLVCRQVYYRDIDTYYEELVSPALAEESVRFTEAWGYFERMAAICEYVKDKAWFLFYFFLRNDSLFIGRVVSLFEELSKDCEVKPSFEVVLNFCDKNPGMNPGSSRYLLDAHRYCREVFEDTPEVLPHLRGLFIDPPICLAKNQDLLMWVKKKAEFFKEQTAGFKLEVNEMYFECLQLILLNKIKSVLILLQDHQMVGVETVTTELLHAYLHNTQTSHSSPLREESRGVCSRMVGRVSEPCEATDLQRVSLYRDLMILHLDRKFQILREVHRLIYEMQELCGFVPVDVICWLYRFYPAGLLGKLQEIQAYKRDQFLKGDLGRIVLNPNLLRGVLELVRQFTGVVVSACPVEKTRKKIDASLTHAVLPAFIPPMGPLVSHFHIDSKLTPKGAVQWVLDSRLDSLGQCRPVIPGSPKTIYLAWSVVAGCPCLCLTFFDERTGEARSTYERLGIPLDELKEEKRRKAFLVFLYSMVQYVFREEAEQGLAKNWDEAQKTFQDSVGCFIGPKELIEHAAKDKNLEGLMGAALAFLERVKIAYRLLNLGRPFFDLSSSALQVAARGDISVVDDHQSLLPRSWLMNQSEREPYLSNVPKDQMEVLQRLFDERTTVFQQLKNTIIISVDGKIEKLAVFYSVDTRVDKDAAPSGSGSFEMEEKALVPPDKYVTISCTFMGEVIRSVMLYEGRVFKNSDLFRKRCNHHFLMLKANVYRHAVES